MSETIHKVSVDQVLSVSRRLVSNYSLFVKHAPKMLRQSMMLAYQTAVDDMLKAMDSAKVEDPIAYKDTNKVVLVDQNGNAT